MPSTNHSIVQSNFIGAWFGSRTYRTHSELNIRINGKRYVPDLCVYPRQQMNLRHDILDRLDLPLLIVEIFSPSQGWEQIQERVDIYLAAGVPSVWIVMPPQGSITVQNADGSQAVHTSGQLKDPGTGLEVDLAEIFS